MSGDENAYLAGETDDDSSRMDHSAVDVEIDSDAGEDGVIITSVNRQKKRKRQLPRDEDIDPETKEKPDDAFMTLFTPKRGQGHRAASTAAGQEGSVAPGSSSTGVARQKVHADLLTTKVRYDSTIECGVTNPKLQDSLLKKAYQGNPPLPKYIDFMYHNHDYERYVAFMCVCFNRSFMFCSLSGDHNKSVQMATLLSSPQPGSGGSNFDRRVKQLNKITRYIDDSSTSELIAPGDLTWTPGVSYPAFGTLDHTDCVPVYNATDTVFNFTTDLPQMSTKLERWPREIPEGSFVVVGYTATTYMGAVYNAGQQSPSTSNTANSKAPKALHLGNNLLWVVVLGTPVEEDSDKGHDSAEGE
ncbi:hypothetical protein DFH06DRAFT_1313887 [Mycena polygramma]|nr:hypothetical protein DFH06DRAFT_1350267 [Mycena polygramma]KAJ7685597.1 hypothetical protein DFH06DRAFT_1313887 [Mycena polygramma]